MIQVNLIPDLKAEFLKAQRTKRFVMGIAAVASAGSIGLVVVMFLYVNVWQQQHTNGLNADIQSLSARYQDIEDLDKVITVQNQLQTLPGLHEDKPLVSRLVTYLSVITPKGTSFSSVDVSFDTFSATLVGNAGSSTDVNRLTNTLKNARYEIQASSDEEATDSPEQLTAFSNVVLDSLNQKDGRASFTIELEFDNVLFESRDEVVLSVPEIDSTNSEVNRPNVDTVFDNEEDEETQ